MIAHVIGNDDGMAVYVSLQMLSNTKCKLQQQLRMSIE